MPRRPQWYVKKFWYEPAGMGHLIEHVKLPSRDWTGARARAGAGLPSPSQSPQPASLPACLPDHSCHPSTQAPSTHPPTHVRALPPGSYPLTYDGHFRLSYAGKVTFEEGRVARMEADCAGQQSVCVEGGGGMGFGAGATVRTHTCTCMHAGAAARPPTPSPPLTPQHNICHAAARTRSAGQRQAAAVRDAGVCGGVQVEPAPRSPPGAGAG